MGAMAKATAKTSAHQRVRTQRGAEAVGSKKAAWEKEVASERAEATAAEKMFGKAQKAQVKKDAAKAAKEAHSAWISWAASAVAPRHGEDRNKIGPAGDKSRSTSGPST